jgi:alginate O-acetyltransferase complex protein AlgJ
MGCMALRHPAPRLSLAAILLLLPSIGIWNMAAGPDHGIRLGPKLGGVTETAPIILSWSAIRDGSLQKAIASRVTDAFALRPILIRLNNEIRSELFGDYTSAYVVRGAKGHLVGRFYLDEYCSRTEGMGTELAAGILPRLTAIQEHYRSSGGTFVYLISPSKAAHLPEYFLDRFNCPSTLAARAQLLPDYVDKLRAAGINVVDGANLIHSKKGQHEVPLFPEGGEHWNDIGSALVVTAIVEEINRQLGREVIPPFRFTYVLSNSKSNADRELADLLNVFFPPLGYLTAKLTFDQPAACTSHEASQLPIALVGSSFGFMPAPMMVEHNCLSRLNFYYYAKLGRFGGQPFRELKQNLTESEMAEAINVRVLILEENESFVGRSNYVPLLQNLIAK